MNSDEYSHSDILEAVNNIQDVNKYDPHYFWLDGVAYKKVRRSNGDVDVTEVLEDE